MKNEKKKLHKIHCWRAAHFFECLNLFSHLPLHFWRDSELLQQILMTERRLVDHIEIIRVGLAATKEEEGKRRQERRGEKGEGERDNKWRE